MHGYMVMPETARETHPGTIPQRKWRNEARSGTVTVAPTEQGRQYLTPLAVVNGLATDDNEARSLVHAIKSESNRAHGELDFRRGLLGRLLERGYHPSFRRAFMDRAVNHYRVTKAPQSRPRFSARRRLAPDNESNRGPLSKSAEESRSVAVVSVVSVVADRSGAERMMVKAQHGGKYHRRVPKPGGGYKYIYSKVDDEPSGEEALRARLKKQIRRHLDKAGPEGIGANALDAFVMRYGPRMIAELIAESGPFTLKGGKIISKGLKVAAPGAGGVGGGSEGSPPGTRKVWSNRIVQKQQDGRWKVVGHVAGFEGEKTPRKKGGPDAAHPASQKKDAKPGADSPGHPELHHNELTQEQADHLIEQLKEKKTEA